MADPGVHLDASRPKRWLLVGLGCVLVAVGAIGVIVPLLPTTPLMLLAAACFARGSRRLHAWLLRSRIFGPTLRDWYETRSIPARAKAVAIALIVLLIGATIVFLVSHVALRIGLAAIGAGVIVYLLRIPTRAVEHAAVDAATPTEPAPAE